MSLPVFLSVLKENLLQVVSAKSRFSLDKQMWHRQANIVPSWCDADMCCEYHVSLDVSLRILPRRCKKQRTAENYSREHTTSRYLVVPHPLDPLASPDNSRQPLHVLLKSSRWGAQTKESVWRFPLIYEKDRVLTFLIQCFYVHAFHEFSAVPLLDC